MKQCNDVFEDVVESSYLEDAETFFRNVDRYDKLRGPLCKLKTRVWDLCSTLMPSIDLRWERARSLEEGRASLGPPEQRPEQGPETPGGDPNTGLDPVDLDQPHTQPQAVQQDDKHKVFLCLPMGRPGEWRLRHAQFMGNAGQPSNVTDKNMFRSVRAEISRYQASRGLARLLFPLRVGKVEYYEVSGRRRLTVDYS